jgi:hypothetical protein|tara:strand:- start:46 stop:363 length:318 start_codon:yes stop_codon:yes gene_type:complete
MGLDENADSRYGADSLGFRPSVRLRGESIGEHQGATGSALQDFGDLGQEARPGGIVLGDQVVGGVQLDEAGAGDLGGRAAGGVSRPETPEMQHSVFKIAEIYAIQ